MRMFYTFLLTNMMSLLNTLDNSKKILYKVSKKLYRELYIHQEWYLLKNHIIPLSNKYFSKIIIPNSDIRWKVTGSPYLFKNPNTSSTTTKHIAYLSLVFHTDDDSYDITDWINEVKWSGDTEPSVKDILTVWSCENGVCIFHILNTIRISAITDTGEMIEKGLNELTQVSIDGSTHRLNPQRILDTVLSSSGR
jgi:hypothetical protein